MVTAMRIILADPNVRTILVNIFGGITRCDDIASGLLLARQQADIRVPIVARLTGTNAEQAQEILKGSPVQPASSMAEAVKKAVALAGGAK
jgi:succinyl-CoA synthetase beta subunit